MDIKTNYVSQQIFDNDLVAIHKIKTTLILCILVLSKVPMYGFLCDYIKNMATNQDYYSQILKAWCMKLKLKVFMMILVRIEKCLILVIILLSQNMTMI